MCTISALDECAACGHGSEDLKTCTACKLVKYCSVSCQKAHRPKHKKQCKKRAAELFDEELFKQPPPKDDCPICFIRLPSPSNESTYQVCCGKTVCNGCINEMNENLSVEGGNCHCPFCRHKYKACEPNERRIIMCNDRIERNDATALIVLGNKHLFGQWGLPENSRKALEIFLRAIELGSSEAHFYVADMYYYGQYHVEKDQKKLCIIISLQPWGDVQHPGKTLLVSSQI